MARKTTGKRSTTKRSKNGGKRRAAASTKRSGATAKRSATSKGSATAATRHPGKTTRKTGKTRTAASRARRASGDFGIPVIEADQVARRTGHPVGAEDLNRPSRSAGEGQRESGVGGFESGPGSSSGGDLDPDIVGVGTGSGLTESAPGAVTTGPASTTGGSEEFASGPPAKGRGNLRPGQRGGAVKGSTQDRSTSPANTGSGGAYEEEPAQKIRDASNDLARDLRRDTR